ncbi:hypothetical protein ACFWN2_06075 [Lentzea sp. NPDC058436]|uniref:hypothetical protein n=1 Tax=Lentzea sp. NPDC058436 TaxID=3346499 RepID=UPI0036570D73
MTAGILGDMPFPSDVVDPRLLEMLGCTEPPSHMAGVVAEAAQARSLGLPARAAHNLALALYWRCRHRLIDFPAITRMRPVDDETLHHVALALSLAPSPGRSGPVIAVVRNQRQELPELANEALSVADQAVRDNWGIATYFGYLLKAFLVAEEQGRLHATGSKVSVLADYRAALARREASASTDHD